MLTAHQTCNACLLPEFDENESSGKQPVDVPETILTGRSKLLRHWQRTGQVSTLQ